MLRSLCFVWAFVFLAGAGLSAAEPLQIPLGQRQLFLDDDCVAAKAGLQQTMHAPVKRGAVVRPDQPWEMWIQTRSRPAWNEHLKRYQLWVTICTPQPGVAGTGYVESVDGMHWTKPNLGVFDYRGSKANNFFVVDPKLSWPLSAMESVVYTPDDPDAARRYKGLLGAEWREAVAGPDGLHWTRIGSPRLPSGDESNLSVDPLTGRYVATLKTWKKYGRAQAVWTSRDFVQWTNENAVFQTDDEDQRLAREIIAARLADPKLQRPWHNNPADYKADVYNMGLFRYEGVFVGLPAIYYATGKAGNNTDGFHLIQLVSTRDFQHWQRLGDRRPFIGPSPLGGDAYDLMQLLPPSAPVVRGDELWFYYSGLKYRDAPANADPKQGAVCLAVLRRDGFVSLDAGTQPGTLLTKPFVVNGERLCVNVDAAGGSLDVELLDTQQKPAAVAETITGDQPHAVVRWKSGDLAALRGQTVCLRCTLRNARFYAFWQAE